MKNIVVLFRTIYSFSPKTSSWKRLFHSFNNSNVKSNLENKMQTQKYDYFLVLDFEATCEKNTLLKPQEIIEFPCLKVSGRTFEIESCFHRYVTPKIHPQLTTFCTQLTGIIQEMVDGQSHLEDVLLEFDEWMKKEILDDATNKFVFVTCGDWDLNVMLPNQCNFFNLEVPFYMKNWINIKQPFCEMTGIWAKGMIPMLKYLQIAHQGRLHSGIDDCRNIASILKALAQKGCVFERTASR